MITGLVKAICLLYTNLIHLSLLQMIFLVSLLYTIFIAFAILTTTYRQWPWFVKFPEVLVLLFGVSGLLRLLRRSQKYLRIWFQYNSRCRTSTSVVWSSPSSSSSTARFRRTGCQRTPRRAWRSPASASKTPSASPSETPTLRSTKPWRESSTMRRATNR